MRLGRAVEALHGYLMTRIVSGLAREFIGAVRQATSCDAIRALHSDFVQAIHDRCLLNDKVAARKTIIFN